jgi:hypothetical protein
MKLDSFVVSLVVVVLGYIHRLRGQGSLTLEGG